MRFFRLMLCIAFAVIALAAHRSTAAQLDPYANLPQSQDLRGFPTLGFPSALVNLLAYVAFDDLESASFWQTSYRGLLPRVQNGEIRVIVVPLVTSGDIPGGRLAARAAICAGEQGRFFQYADLVFAQLAAFRADAFTGDFLDRAARDTGLDLRRYQECTTLSDGPDAVLSDAEESAARDTFFTAVPYVKLNESPSLTTLDSLNFSIDVQLEQANADLIESMITPTIDPAATDEVVPVELPPVTGQQVPPPVQIALPPGWQSGVDVLVIQDVDAIRNIPFAVYTGPVTGGMATIVLMWGFPNLLPASAVDANGQVREELLDLYIDGTRLLRVAILEQGCNIGTDIRRPYSIGGLQAVGTSFAAVDCPMLTDTRGWFAGLRQYGLNFLFYAFIEPIDAHDGAAGEVQAILDSVQFVLPPTPTPTPAAP